MRSLLTIISLSVKLAPPIVSLVCVVLQLVKDFSINQGLGVSSYAFGFVGFLVEQVGLISFRDSQRTF